jgi:diadenosine tetraphosphatase ApaH/serine/threonine PP2A family protein phosphatase
MAMGQVLALLSDVHANFEALEACLRHARERGAGRFAFLGDLVGYGADPQRVVDRVAGLVAEGAVAVKGNHDAAVASDATYMNENARESIEWTRRVLGNEAKAFLARLPLYVRDGDISFVHASAASPERWDYVDSVGAAWRSLQAASTVYTFSGHVHVQEAYFSTPQGRAMVFHPLPGVEVPLPANRCWLALVGSVGQPRDRNPAAAYALFDVARARITFHRVSYDHRAAAQRIRAAGLPESLAYRIEKGI